VPLHSVLCQATAPPRQLRSAGTTSRGEVKMHFLRCKVQSGVVCLYLIVPASRGLKAYSQSFMSFSLLACRRIPLCFVHTAKVLGV